MLGEDTLDTITPRHFRIKLGDMWIVKQCVLSTRPRRQPSGRRRQLAATQNRADKTLAAFSIPTSSISTPRSTALVSPTTPKEKRKSLRRVPMGMRKSYAQNRKTRANKWVNDQHGLSQKWNAGLEQTQEVWMSQPGRQLKLPHLRVSITPPEWSDTPLPRKITRASDMFPVGVIFDGLISRYTHAHESHGHSLQHADRTQLINYLKTCQRRNPAARPTVFRTAKYIRNIVTDAAFASSNGAFSGL